jgi:hypothetical protein
MIPVRSDRPWTGSSATLGLVPSSPPIDSITFALPDRPERRTVSDLSPHLLDRAPSPKTPPISALVPTLNNASTLASTLRSLAWCDEVFVLDAGSTDATQAVAERFPNVRWCTGAIASNAYGHPAEARHDWILVVEADEIVSTELARELIQLRPELCVVYTVPQETWFRGRNITRCGWAQQRRPRLFNRRVSGIVVAGGEITVETRHLSTQPLGAAVRRSLDDSLDQFLVMTHLSARGFASRRLDHRAATPAGAVLRAACTFAYRYVLRGGWRLGADGLAVCVAQAQTTFWKHLFLRDAIRAQRSAPAKTPATR